MEENIDTHKVEENPIKIENITKNIQTLNEIPNEIAIIEKIEKKHSMKIK